MPYMITVNTSICITASERQVLVTDDKEHFYSINGGETWRRLEKQMIWEMYLQWLY